MSPSSHRPKRRPPAKPKSAPAGTPAREKPERVPAFVVTSGEETFQVRDRLPLLPLRDVVVFPSMTIPLLVGRLPSINALEKAVARDRLLFVTAQTRSEVADPTHEELHPVGTLARVLQIFRLPDGTMRVLVEGLARCRARRFLWSSDYFTVNLAL